MSWNLNEQVFELVMSAMEIACSNGLHDSREWNRQLIRTEDACCAASRQLSCVANARRKRRSDTEHHELREQSVSMSGGNGLDQDSRPRVSAPKDNREVLRRTERCMQPPPDAFRRKRGQTEEMLKSRDTYRKIDG